jgi:hypothetical protein
MTIIWRCAMSGAVVAAMIQAVKASGTIVRVGPEEFERLLHRQKEPLVVHSVGGVFTTRHLYLMSFKGLAFFTKSPEPLHLPGGSDVVEAKSIWVPG